MTYEKNKNIIYNDMRYNRYMTGDRNQNLGEVISKKIPNFVIIMIVKNSYISLYVYETQIFFDHKNKYMVNIRKKHI